MKFHAFRLQFPHSFYSQMPLSFDKCFLKLFRRISKIRLLVQLPDSIMYFCVQIPLKSGFKTKEGLLVQEGEGSRSSRLQVKLGPGAHRVSSRLSLASFLSSVFQDISVIFKSHTLASSSCRLLTATTPNAGGELHTKLSKRKRRDSSSSSHGREDLIHILGVQGQCLLSPPLTVTIIKPVLTIKGRICIRWLRIMDLQEVPAWSVPPVTSHDDLLSSLNLPVSCLSPDPPTDCVLCLHAPPPEFLLSAHPQGLVPKAS